MDEIRWTPSINSARIGVAVDHGSVTLSGEVDSYPERLLAEKAALRVRGVTAVAEEVTVHNTWGARNDSEIAVEATDALERAVDVPSDSVKAVVRSHHITLSGEVPWHYQREAADRAVRYVRGVFGVSNSISVKPTVTPVGLKTAITAALVRNAQLEGSAITVTTDGGHITLEGAVHSWAERRQADTAAWSAPGVTNVSNHLRIAN